MVKARASDIRRGRFISVRHEKKTLKKTDTFGLRRKIVAVRIKRGKVMGQRSYFVGGLNGQ